MPGPSTFERVYAELKQRLRSGAFRPGQRLEPASLSADLHASVTPIRDALHRLTGERLVEAPPHEGFRIPMPSETLLRFLYDWHRDLLLLALTRRAQNTPAATLSERQQQGLDALLEELVARTGNPEHLRALRNVRERLEPFERLEARLLGDLGDEISAIAAACASGNARALRRSLIAYHRRRNRLVPQLLALALEPADNHSPISPS